MTENSRPTEQEEGEGHTDIVRLFITDLNCRSNAPGQYGRTPLHYAEVGSHLHVMKY